MIQHLPPDGRNDLIECQCSIQKILILRPSGKERVSLRVRRNPIPSLKRKPNLGPSIRSSLRLGVTPKGKEKPKPKPTNKNLSPSLRVRPSCRPNRTPKPKNQKPETKSPEPKGRDKKARNQKPETEPEPQATPKKWAIVNMSKRVPAPC